MTNSNDDRDYDVGYGKPPKHSQFKSGQSGNPKGRPKGNKDAKTIFNERLYSKIAITENGRRRTLPVIEVLFRQIIKSALGGDARAQDRLLKLLPLANADDAADDKATDMLGLGETDEAILQNFLQTAGKDLLDMQNPNDDENEENEQ